MALRGERQAKSRSGIIITIHIPVEKNVREKCFCLDGNKRKRAFLGDCSRHRPCAGVMRYPWAHPPNCSIFHCFTQQPSLSISLRVPRRTQSGSVHAGITESAGSFFTHSNLGAGWLAIMAIPSHERLCALASLSRICASPFCISNIISVCQRGGAQPWCASGSWEISKRAPKRVLLAGAHSLEKLPLAHTHTHLISS